jgi:hypothetical protein
MVLGPDVEAAHPNLLQHFVGRDVVDSGVGLDPAQPERLNAGEQHRHATRRAAAAREGMSEK